MKEQGLEKVVRNDILIEWVHQYTDYLLRWAIIKTNNKEVAEDLVQETFISAHIGLDKFKQKSSPKTWLIAILKNKIIDHHRTHLKHFVPSSQLAGSGLDEWFDEYGNWKKDQRPQLWESDPENLMENTDFQLVLKKCLSALPEKWMSAVQLKYLEEKNARDICQELNISTTNYWQLLHRAKLKLRNCINTNWFKK